MILGAGEEIRASPLTRKNSAAITPLTRPRPTLPCRSQRTVRVDGRCPGPSDRPQHQPNLWKGVELRLGTPYRRKKHLRKQSRQRSFTTHNPPLFRASDRCEADTPREQLGHDRPCVRRIFRQHPAPGNAGSTKKPFDVGPFGNSGEFWISSLPVRRL